MQDFVVDFYKTTNIIDVLYLIITIFTLIGGYRKGFVLSIISMARWFIAYIITLIIFPRAKPYLKGTIDNEYVLDIVLCITIFVIVIFLILMISRGIKKAVRFTGLGSLDTMFGFFFGFIKAYIISVCIFSGVHIVYNHDKWPVNLSKSLIFPYLEKGSNYLLEKFPDEKTYQKSKEKIENI